MTITGPGPPDLLVTSPDNVPRAAVPAAAATTRPVTSDERPGVQPGTARVGPSVGTERHRRVDHPAGVVIAPEGIARGVLFLVSDDAAMIHGITLYVDGGITATRMG